MAFYGSVADADAYHLARGNATWTGSNEVKQAALTRASAYIDGRYRYVPKCGASWPLFSGEKTGGRAQELAWPRTGATDVDGNEIPDNEVPREVEHATYEAALRELVTPGSLSPDFVPSGQVTKEKVDVIEVTYAEARGMPGLPPNMPVIPAIDQIIGTLLNGVCCGPTVFVV